MKSSPYFPQGNGHSEAINKTVLRILSKMVYKEPQKWTDTLSDELIAPRGMFQDKLHLSLVYRVDAIIFIEVMVSSS